MNLKKQESSASSPRTHSNPLNPMTSSKDPEKLYLQTFSSVKKHLTHWINSDKLTMTVMVMILSHRMDR